MKKVFIASPFRGAEENQQKFIEYAKGLCLFAIGKECAPFAPHLLYPQFLNDSNFFEREQGIAAGLQFLNSCDEFWVGERFGVSSGMSSEIEFALNNGFEFYHKRDNISYYKKED